MWNLRLIGLAALTVGANTVFAQELSTASALMPTTISELTQRQFNRNASFGVAQGPVPSTAFAIELRGRDAFFGQRFSSPLNVSAFDGLQFKVRNTGTTVTNMAVRISSGVSATDETKAIFRHLYVPQGEVRTWTIYFERTSQSNLRVLPTDSQWQPIVVQPVGNVFDKTSVWKWLFWNLNPATSQFIVEDVKLVNRKSDLTGIIDSFGNLATSNFSGKVNSVSELTSDRDNEQTELANLPDQPILGSTVENNLGRNGRWRLRKLSNGNWMMVTPAGRPFWSIGLNDMVLGIQTGIEGRESLFADLPSRDGDFASHYRVMPVNGVPNQLAFDFHTYNLQRKFGSNWRNQSAEVTKTRMKKWGFNTIGAQSSLAYIDDTIPYTVSFYTSSFPVRLNTPLKHNRNLPDVFSASFSNYCLNEFRRTLRSYPRRSNLMGAFVDNEHNWGATGTDAGKTMIGMVALNSNPTQPAKVAFLQQLRTKYGNIGALNNAWGTTYGSFAQLEPANAWGSTIGNSAFVNDCSTFLRAFSKRYYTTIKGALGRAGYRGLYLGSRLMSEFAPMEVIESSYGIADILSVNHYADFQGSFGVIDQITRPFIISEFGFPLAERGGGAGFDFDANTREERARAVERYVTGARALPNCVGVHMYAYKDSPMTGRVFDYESWMTSLVDITDRPYTEMVDVFTRLSETIYRSRM